MKLVVTGSDGGLARAFLAQVPGHHDVIPVSHGELDVGDHHAVMRAIPPLAPDAILSFGAMTDVDRCELEPEDAYRTNALGPHSLALAEAFLTPLQAAGLPQRETALAFSLIYDYTLGFALTDRTTVNEQRVQDTATRRQLHSFFRSLPADRFPALTALGEHIWTDNRDQRFTASLDTLLGGIQTARRRSARQPRR